ncbi:MAG: DUF1116 domain-containing protein [Candidatus Atribacteria bacterium]|jgi:hypothetical protein|nr:MAG: DUF1116 domain-containing protein [Candidatus Atribacteria bacterium]
MSERKPTTALFSDPLRVVNLGLSSFAETLRASRVPVIDVDWRPPAGGDAALIRIIDNLKSDDEHAWSATITAANEKAIEHLLSAEPHLIGIGIARDVVPGMTDRTLLHAGPPITWDAMCGPMRGAVMGGLIYERAASTPDSAAQLAASGDITFDPCHHHQSVGPMAGVMTASMPVWIIENVTAGNRAYCTLNEGLGQVLRYGAFGDEVISRLNWMQNELAPILSQAIEKHGPIDMRSLLAQALQMGDEGHNRNRAGTSLLIRELAPFLVRLSEPSESIARVLEFLHSNDHFFLNLTMPAGKCALDAAADIPGSSLVTVMARNGTQFGIRVSGTGDRWFTAPAPIVDGLYLPGFSAQDAAPDIGDSAITETAGYGGFAMAAAPAIVQFVGGTPQLALDTTHRMRSITMAESRSYQIPAMGFRGTPTGIDVLRVAETGILPAINTGIAHKEPGIGMVGAGLVTPPFSVFADAARALAESLGKQEKDQMAAS